VPPLPREQLAFGSPAGDIRSHRDWLEIFRELLDHGSRLIRLEKSLSGVLDMEHLEFRSERHFAGARGQPERGAASPARN
jgi:hypothetical protein